MPVKQKEIEKIEASYKGDNYTVIDDGKFITAFRNGDQYNQVSSEKYRLDGKVDLDIERYGFFIVISRDVKERQNVVPIDGNQGTLFAEDAFELSILGDMIFAKFRSGTDACFDGYTYPSGNHFLKAEDGFRFIVLVASKELIFLSKNYDIGNLHYISSGIQGFYTNGKPYFKKPAAGMYVYHFDTIQYGAGKTLCFFQLESGLNSKILITDGKGKKIVTVDSYEAETYRNPIIVKGNDGFWYHVNESFSYTIGDYMNIINPVNMKPMFPQDVSSITGDNNRRLPDNVLIVVDKQGRVNLWCNMVDAKTGPVYMFDETFDKIALMVMIDDVDWNNYLMTKRGGVVNVMKFDKKLRTYKQLKFKNSDLKDFDAFIYYNPEDTSFKAYRNIVTGSQKISQVVICSRDIHALSILKKDDRFYILWYDDCLYEVEPSTIRSISEAYSRIAPFALFRKPNGDWFGNILSNTTKKQKLFSTGLKDKDMPAILYPNNDICIKKEDEYIMTILVQGKDGDIYDLDISKKPSELKFI